MRSVNDKTMNIQAAPITTIVFDFDNTLLDTEYIKECLVGIVEEVGGNKEDEINIYHDVSVEDGKVVFSLEKCFEGMKRYFQEKYSTTITDVE